MPNRVIKSERARLGYNQQFIADKLGVSKSTYNLKEKWQKRVHRNRNENIKYYIWKVIR